MLGELRMSTSNNGGGWPDIDINLGGPPAQYYRQHDYRRPVYQPLFNNLSPFIQNLIGIVIVLLIVFIIGIITVSYFSSKDKLTPSMSPNTKPSWFPFSQMKF